MKHTKIIALLLCIVMAAAMLFGCAGESNTPATTPNEGQQGTTTNEGQQGGSEQPTGEVKYKEEIVIAMADEFTTIDPMETTAETNQIVQDLSLIHI